MQGGVHINVDECSSEYIKQDEKISNTSYNEDQDKR